MKIWVGDLYSDNELITQKYAATSAIARRELAGYLRETWENGYEVGPAPDDDEKVIANFEEKGWELSILDYEMTET